MKGLRTAWERWRIPCAACPAVPASLILGAGIMAGAACCRDPAAVLAAAAWLGVGGSVAVIVVPWRRWRLACLPAGLLLMAVHHAAPWDRLTQALPRPACRASVRGVVRDAHCHGDAAEALPLPSSALAGAEHLRLPGLSPWQPVSGTILLLLPDGTELAYGDRFEATGIFLPPTPTPFPRAFDYHEYLRHTGVRQLFQVQHLSRRGPPVGARAAVRRLLDCRDALAGRLVQHVRSEKNAGILLAMTFGFRQSLAADTREAFLRSGTIHVFSVSGLHVAIVGAVLGSILYLVGVPYRWRYAILPLLLGIYVLMTGSAPPALRAWLMVCAVSWSKACFLRVSPLNGVAVAALVIMAGNPLVLFQAGFLYSFVTVTVLILGWPLISALVAALGERDLWLPRRQRPRWRRQAIRMAIQAAGASVLAWFGGSGLMLYLSGMLVPAALPVNILLVVLAHLLLVLALPKALLACLPWAGPDRLAAGLLEMLVEWIRVLVTCGSAPAGSWAVPSPPLLLIVVYYAALCIVLAPRLPRPVRSVAAVTAVTLLAVGAWAPWRCPALALVWGGDGDVPVVALERPGRLPPLIIHSGTSDAQRALLAWLQLRGHRRVDALIFGWDTRRAAAAAAAATRLLHPDTLVVPAEPRPGSFLAKACRIQQERGARVRRLQPVADDPSRGDGNWPGGDILAEVTSDRRRLRVATSAADGSLELELTCEATGRYRLTLRQNGEPVFADSGIPCLQRRLLTAPFATRSEPPTRIDLEPLRAILPARGSTSSPATAAGP